ncbi:hypothetical protein SLEP1_g5642 [Rubroshorea leprosula]|uniref:Chalcone-flavonone isomerase family protein n=1 Tax=Rubroshorea leprosula TaxID=152421 RepID=A0AAV5HYV4_9ROSI|nr:hypothetical protein SLEP1_g5642 [Rubroshorea leprosula]
MPSSLAVSEVQVETVTFPPSVKPPGSTKYLFLGGAGVRIGPYQGKLDKVTAIGVYLEDTAVPSLADKWRGKTAAELTESNEFFKNVVTGPFEKFIRVTLILTLTGQEYSEKVMENSLAILKSAGNYSDTEAKAVEKFIEVFKDENHPPGSLILFTVSPYGNGTLKIGFSEDGSIPEVVNAVIENKLLGEAVLESIIGEHGVSPAARKSLAERLPELFKDGEDKLTGNGNA